MSKFLDHVIINPKITLNVGDVYPFIEMGNVSTNYREPVDFELKPFDSGVKFQDGDTVIARITPCLQNGKRFFCKNIGVGFGSTEFLVFRPKNNNELDNRFLYYFMQKDLIVKKMIASMTGATGRQRVNNAVFQSLDVVLPNIDTQRHIADILSAYDDLIENSRKQIKLLEEAAQRLYRELFVNMRFPGHEDTAIVDGVPDGWNIQKFCEVFDYVRGKSYSSKELSDSDGVLMVNLKNIRAFGGYKRNVEKRYTGQYNINHILQAGDIIMGVTDMTSERRLVGHVAIVPNFGQKAIFSMDLIKLIPKHIPGSFLYSAMFYGGYSKKISQLANGVNVLHLKPEAMMNMKMLIPSEITINAYDEFFTQIQRKIEILQTQSNLATEARDRLLPKLMSGKIKV